MGGAATAAAPLTLTTAVDGAAAYGPTVVSARSGQPDDFLAVPAPGAQTWSFTPNDGGDPLAGGTLTSGGYYLTQGEEPVGAPDNLCMVCDTSPVNLVAVVPVQLDDGHFCLRRVDPTVTGGPMFVMTLHPDSGVTRWEPLGPTDSADGLQRFVIVGSVPGLIAGRTMWISQTGTDSALVDPTESLGTPGAAVASAALSGEPQQLFWSATAPDSPAQLVSLTTGLVLDLGPPANGATPIVLDTPAAPAPPSQLWSFKGGALVNQQAGDVATASSDGSITVAPAATPLGPGQQWAPVPYLESPGTDDQFPSLKPGSPFAILDYSGQWRLTAALQIDPVAGGSGDKTAWQYADGQLVEQASGNVLTAGADGSLSLAPAAAGNLGQSWILNSKGLVFSRLAPKQVLRPLAYYEGAVVDLLAYDPTGTTPQSWSILPV